MSIRARLLWLTLIATLLPAVLVGIRFFHDRSNAIEAAVSDLPAFADEIGEDIDDKILGTAQFLYGLARARDLDTTDRVACSRFLSAVREQYPQYTGILTVSPDGNLFCDSLETARELNLTDRAYFKQALSMDGGVALEPTFGRLTGLSVLQVAFPARADDGQLLFVLLASLNLKLVAEVHARRLAKLNVALVDRNGIVLAWLSDNRSSALVGTSIAGTSLFGVVRERSDIRVAELEGVSGETEVWAVAELSKSLREAGLHVLVGRPKSDLVAPANRRLLENMGSLVAIASVLFLCVWALAEVSIRRQVSRIATLAMRLGQGDLGARIAGPLPTGELGELMAVLNEAAASLNRARTGIEDYRNRLERLIDQAKVGILVHHNFVPILANRELARLLAYDSPDEIMALENCAGIFAEDERERIATFNEARQKGEGAPAVYRVKGNRRDGARLVMENRAFTIEWGGQKAVCAMLTDITQQLETEDNLRQAHRMEAIGQLTGGVAHDFNNLLTVILGNAETLVERLAGNPQLKGVAEVTVNAAERGAELTSSLLAFARRQPLNPRPTDVNGQIHSMDRLLRRTLGEHIEVRIVPGRSSWNAMVDAGQLENAILNLCLNARDAMPEGGRLTIETANVDLDDAYAKTQREVAPGQYVLVAVSDTGIGMDRETLARVFEPFFTTKGAGKGSGLGLSMVYGFVKQSDGHIRIYSEPGQGTTVRLYLPRADAQVDSSPALAESSVVELGNERILLVEDDELVRTHVSRQLQDLGYSVVDVDNGAEALEILKQDRAFDLLFTDIVMPGGMNGPQLAEKAAKLAPELPVLFMSGYTENAIVHHGRLDAGVQLIVKPFRRRELAARLRAIMAARNADNGQG